MPDYDLFYGASSVIFERAKILRNNLTIQEQKLWNRIRKNQLGYKFRRQHPFGRYILDFYCHQKSLSIEIDGVSHQSKKNKEDDQYRTKFLNEVGIKELRFHNYEVDQNIEKVIQQIKDTL